MKRNRFFTAATTTLLALSAVSGAALASETHDAAELQQFLKDNPSMTALVDPVQTATGGTVVGMELDDEKTADVTLVEVDVKMADGSTQAFMVNPQTKAVMAQQEKRDDEDGDGVDSGAETEVEND
ncbi:MULTISPECIES: hypothetical protein [Rhodobacterales]|uniref:hypothetical protein n=1 Tax=Roseobacter sp. N2S TaxID=2663844 RepID=UPI00285539BE|nr:MULTISPECIES: hypothetical protein [Rhodobacterales]MDR6266609.1 hypothetical protein [Roseobacter sp. N2S]